MGKWLPVNNLADEVSVYCQAESFVSASASTAALNDMPHFSHVMVRDVK